MYALAILGRGVSGWEQTFGGLMSVDLAYVSQHIRLRQSLLDLDSGRVADKVNLHLAFIVQPYSGKNSKSKP